jgi:Fic family protein
VSSDRQSKADPVELIIDPELKARREAENGVRQFKLAVQIIRSAIPNDDGSFKLRQATILRLHKETLDGIHPLAGTYRNSRVFIGNSQHLPPKAFEVPDHVADMCEYINSNWNNKNACHLSSYALWRLNWIHPFADGNGRTARVVSYLILNIRLRSLLPGSPTIPDLIAADKNQYYSELEKADGAWRLEKLDISGMEKMMEELLGRQLSSATEEAGL